MAFNTSPLQDRFILETLIAVYTEMDASDDFSQPMLDDFVEVLTILGVDIDHVK